MPHVTLRLMGRTSPPTFAHRLGALQRDWYRCAVARLSGSLIHSSSFRLCLIVAVILLGGLSPHLAAQTTNWTSNSSGTWSNAANWDNGVPNSSVNAVINTSNGITFTGASSAHNLDLVAGTLAGNISNPGNVLNVSGSMSNGGVLDVGQLTSSAGPNSLNVAGNFSNTGSFFTQGNSKTGTVTVGGDFTNSGVLNSGEYDFSVGGNLSNNGAIDITSACGLCNLPKGTIFMPGTLTIGGLLTNNGSLDIHGFAETFELSPPNTAPTVLARVTAAGYSGTGSINISVGLLDVRTGGSNTFAPLDANGNLAYGNIFIEGSGGLRIDPSGPQGGIVNIASGVTLSTGATSIQYGNDGTGLGTNALSTLTSNAGSLAITVGQLTTNGDLVNSGVLSLSSSPPKYGVGSGNLPIVLAAAYATHLNPSGNFTNSGTLTLNSTVVPVLPFGFGGKNLGPLAFVSSVNPSGDFVNTGTVNANGALSAGGNLTNSGAMTVTGAQLPPKTELSGGLAPGRLAIAGDATNSGSLTLQNFSVGSVGGAFTNSGSLAVDSTSTLSAASYTQSAGSTQINGNLSASSVTINGGILSGNGSITGNLMMNGTMALGGTPAVFTVNGDYTQGTTGIYQAQISGLGNSQLKISGNAAFGGTLSVTIFGSNPPLVLTAGEDFVLMTFGSFTGAFGEVDLPTLAADLDWILHYDQNDLTLSIAEQQGTPTPEPTSLILLASGFAGVFKLSRRRRA